MTERQPQQQQQNPQPTTDLRARRETLGLSRMEVAALAGVSVGALHHIEAGVTRKGIVKDKVDRILTDMENAA